MIIGTFFADVHDRDRDRALPNPDTVDSRYYSVAIILSVVIIFKISFIL